MAVSSVGSVASSTVNQDEFLRLFVAQLKNQNPMDPLKGHEFIAQLAQFSSLEQLTNLNTSFAEEFKFQQLLGGGDLIGRNARYVDTVLGDIGEGLIQGSKITDGITTVTINNQDIPITDLIGIF